MNPLVDIRQFDQSLWLDFISRPIIIDGKLQHRIQNEALRGVTSNPAIFAKSIGDTADYDSSIKALALQGKTTDESTPTWPWPTCRPPATCFARSTTARATAPTAT